jgi:phosphoglycolate phosphatase
MRFQTLLWDLDGTLIDSAGDIAASVNLVRAELGHAPLTLAEVKTFVGDGLQMLIKRSIPEPDREPALQLFWKFYLEHCLDQTRAYPGIPDVLALAKRARMRQAIVTNKPGAFSEKIVAGLGWSELFGVVIGGDNPCGKKPLPAPLKLALEELDSTQDQALMIGDGINDVLSARALGIPVCGVLFGIGAADKMRELKPDYLAETPADLLKILEL